MTGPETAAQVKHLFRGIWSLEDFQTSDEVMAVIQKAIKCPDCFVMKP